MSSEDTREVAVRKYFRPSSPKVSYRKINIAKWTGFLIAILGIPILAVGILPGMLMILFGFILFIAKLVSLRRRKAEYRILYKKREPKPSDEQMDKWFESDKNQIIKEAMKKLDLIPEQTLNENDPLVIVGPFVGPTEQNYAKEGQDGIYRFSDYEVVVIYLTNYHLAAFSCHLDFFDGSIIRGLTQEYHYTDIVSVETLYVNSDFELTEYDKDGKEVKRSIKEQQQFALSVASGQSITVTTALTQLQDVLQNDKLMPTGSEKAIKTIRAMLREKKGGIQEI